MVHGNMKVSSSSLFSDNIRNGNYILVKGTHKAMDIGARLDVKFRGGRNFILKKLIC